VQIIDAWTGSRLSLSGVGLAGGGPHFIWAADGSGLLVSGVWDQSLCPREPCVVDAPLGIFPIDGGPIVPGVPELYPRPYARRFAQGGRSIDVYARSTEGVVVGEGWVQDAEGVPDFATRTTWYSDELAPATLQDSSFSADGRSVWVLLDGDDGAQTILAHVSTPGSVEVVATEPVGTGFEFGTIGGMAPDDSLVAVSHYYPDAQSTLTLVATGGQTASTHGGSLAGFVPTSLADSWPGEGSFAPVPDEPHPDMTPTPSGSITP
jgi:catechol 2,3-dioxygenase-like lactoylglutathione lyase family enzyme